MLLALPGYRSIVLIEPANWVAVWVAELTPTSWNWLIVSVTPPVCVADWLAPVTPMPWNWVIVP